MKDTLNVNDSENEDEVVENEPKKIEIVTGDGNLSISPVYKHIEAEKPRPKDTRDVVVPKVKKNVTSTENDSENTTDDLLENSSEDSI